MIGGRHLETEGHLLSSDSGLDECIRSIQYFVDLGDKARKAAFTSSCPLSDALAPAVMEYAFSTVIEPSSYETEGLCEGIDLRQSKYSYFEERGAIRAQRDWAKWVAPVPATGFRGSLGPRYNFLTLTVPECKPERLEIIAYANEFAFLHDGKLLYNRILPPPPPFPMN